MTGCRAALISVAFLFAASVARTATEHLPDATVRPLVVVSADMDAVPVELPGATYHSLEVRLKFTVFGCSFPT